MIETVLQQPLATARDRVGAWRQLTDILAQRGDRLPLDIAARGLRALAVLRDSIPVPIRRATAAAVARRVRFAPLVAFYGADEASVARAMLSQVQMSDAAWQAYLPASNPVSRATLRERSDLSPAVERPIAAFGEASLRLPHAAAEAVADEPLRLAAAELMAEAASTVDGGPEPRTYADQTLRRFADPWLRHRTAQVAMDGSQKLPGRLIGTARDRLAAGRSADAALLGIAAWMAHVAGTLGAGSGPDDPLADRLGRAVAGRESDPVAVVDGLLAVTEIFEPEFAGDPAVRRTLREQLADLQSFSGHRSAAAPQARRA